MYAQETFELLARVASRFGVTKDRVAVAEVTGIRRRTLKMAVWRRRALRSHLVAQLAGIAGGGGDPEAPRESDSPEASTAPDLDAKICAACRGGCCVRGQEHAYLQADTLARARTDRPGATNEDLIALYLSYVPDRTYRGSCIYHGATGCGLPVDLRSRTCRTFACGALRLVQSRHDLEGVAVVQSDAGYRRKVRIFPATESHNVLV